MPGAQHNQNSLPEEVWEEDSLLKFMISLRNPVLRVAQRRKSSLGELLGGGLLIKICDFFKAILKAGKGFLIQINDFLKESSAQAIQLPKEENPLQMNFGTGFLIKINDFLKESLLQSSPQRVFLSGSLWKGIPY